MDIIRWHFHYTYLGCHEESTDHCITRKTRANAIFACINAQAILKSNLKFYF